MRDLIDRVRHGVRRRPHRIVEAGVGLLVAVGVLAGDADELTRALLLLAGAVGIGGAEAAQRGTTPLYDPRDGQGRSLVPSDDPHAAHHYEAG